MTTLAATPTTQAAPAQRARAAALAQGAALVGAATCIAFTLVWLLMPLTPDRHEFRYAGDYWFTGLGLPLVGVPLVLLPALRTLQEGRDGRRGRAGIVLTSCALGVLAVLLVTSLVEGRETSWGPTYILATAVGIVGVWLFAAGSFRAGLLPRWLLVAWAIAWTVGGTLGPLGSQMLLAVAYLLIAATLFRRGGH